MVYGDRINVKNIMPLYFIEQIGFILNNKGKLPSFFENTRKLKYLQYFVVYKVLKRF